MFSISTYWIFLLGIRPFIEYVNIPSVIVSATITGLQIMDLFLNFEKKGFKLSVYHLLLIFFVFVLIYNYATLATVNIVLAVILLEKEKLSNISTKCFVSIITALFIYLSLLALNVIQDEVVRMPKGVAHTFGFSNSNGIGAFTLQLTLVVYVFIVAHFKRFHWVYLCFFVILNYYIYIFSLGRTSFYTSIVFFVVIVLFSIGKFFFWNKRFYFSLMPLFLLLCTVVLCNVYEQYPMLDVLFTTRFSKNSVHLNALTPINYFIGYKLPPGPMDSAYLAQFFAGGILSLCFFISATTKGIMELSFHDWLRYAPVVFCMLISGFAENTFSTFSLQTVLFYRILFDQSPSKNIKRRYWGVKL